MGRQTGDFEMWQAMHAECGTDASCCVLLELDLDLEVETGIQALAWLRRESFEATLQRVLWSGLERFRGGRLGDAT